jgi:hypothetical protein
MICGASPIAAASQSFHKFSQRHGKAARDRVDVPQCKVPFASLNASNVCTIQVTLFSKSFL